MRAALAPDAERLTPTAFLAALRALVPQAQPRFAVGAATTVGLNPDRPVNEDAFGYSLRHLEAHEGSRLLLRACVADGMGGMAAGEVAARAAVEAFIGGAVPAPGDAGVQAEWAVDLVWQANRRVLEALAGEDGGCAFSGVVLVGSRVALAHVGDTRVYLRAAGGLRQLSRDHSLVAAMVASGMLTEEEAESSPDRNKILRSLGSVRQPQPDYVQGLSATQDEPTLELQPGEALVLLSDGVWGEVKPARLEQILAEHQQDPQAAADALVRAALEAGAPDNATAVIVQRER
nr:PP2C family serine/threonine-protein phosphatase [Deinobacterium chartae]